MTEDKLIQDLKKFKKSLGLNKDTGIEIKTIHIIAVIVSLLIIFIFTGTAATTFKIWGF
jgi:hypothetical protein